MNSKPLYGLIIADDAELSFLPFALKNQLKIKHFQYYFFENSQFKIVVVLSGVGLLNASAAVQCFLEHFPDVKQLFSIGACGASSKWNLYDIICPQKIFLAHVRTPWYSYGQIPGMSKYYLNQLNWNLLPKDYKFSNHLSSNYFVNQQKDLNYFQKYFQDVSTFDMETAAILAIASHYQIKVGVIRCVSDVVGFNQLSQKELNNHFTKAAKKAYQACYHYLTQI